MQKLTAAQEAEIEALKRMPDDKIDTSDIPDDIDFSNAVVGKFYRGRKRKVTVQLDPDVAAWIGSAAPDFEARVNSLLRDLMSQSK